jgi:Acyl-CoA dehydrogenase, C-terminal domain
MVKVFAAEMLDYVADEGVQIHGGYGFHKDYAVERYYRDARINRLFEGTSEINRFVITGMPLKRAAKGQGSLLEAAKETVSKATNSKSSMTDAALVQNSKQIALLALGLAHQKHGADLEKQQEVVMNISDCLLEAFAMESTWLRSGKMEAAGNGAVAADICSVFLRDAIARIESAARTVIGACCEDAAAAKFTDIVRRLATYNPVNTVALRRRIAEAVISSERYPF